MSNPKRKRRWVMWLSTVALALTLGLAGYSEFNAVSYRENTYGMANRFVLYRSSVTCVYRPGPDKVMLTGLEVFEPGWSIARFVPRDAYLRRWVPSYTHDDGSIGEYWVVIVPLWIPAAVLAAGVWWGRRGEWTGEGACRKCGYDVRGVVGGKCPECGNAITAQTARCNNPSA